MNSLWGAKLVSVVLLSGAVSSPLWIDKLQLSGTSFKTGVEMSDPNDRGKLVRGKSGGKKSEPDDGGGSVGEPGTDGTGGTGGGATGEDLLLPLDLSDMALWNWSGQWHASHWDHAFSDIPWRYDHVAQTDGDTLFRLDADGAPELKAEAPAAVRSGLWEVDVTLPQMQRGLVAAPIWLYNQGNGDEIDIEMAGEHGMQVTLHSYRTGSHQKASATIPDSRRLYGTRVRLGIDVDLDAGYAEFIVDGVTVHTFYRSQHEAAFPTTALKPIISMWTAKRGLGWAEGWLGSWDGTPATMTVHGYRYTG